MPFKARRKGKSVSVCVPPHIVFISLILTLIPVQPFFFLSVASLSYWLPPSLNYGHALTNFHLSTLEYPRRQQRGKWSPQARNIVLQNITGIEKGKYVQLPVCMHRWNSQHLPHQG